MWIIYDMQPPGISGIKEGISERKNEWARDLYREIN
jgi:hypothetical protein